MLGLAYLLNQDFSYQLMVLVNSVSFMVALLMTVLAIWSAHRYRQSSSLIMSSIYPSITSILVFIWFSFVVVVLVNYTPSHPAWLWFDYMIRDIYCLLIIALFWRVSNKIQQKILAKKYRRKTVDRELVTLLIKCIKIMLIVLVVFVFLQQLGLPVSSVLAFTSVTSLGIAFAAKELLANFFSGFLMMIDKPIRIGDWVIIPSLNVEGHVEMIGWRMTMIRSVDKQPCFVPNSVFSTDMLVNVSKRSHRHILFDIIVDGDIDDVQQLLQDYRHYLSQYERIDHELHEIVALHDIDHYLHVKVRCYTQEISLAGFHEIKEELLLEFMNKMKDHQVILAKTVSV